MQTHEAQLTANHEYRLEMVSTAYGRWLLQKLPLMVREIPLTIRS